MAAEWHIVQFLFWRQALAQRLWPLAFPNVERLGSKEVKLLPLASHGLDEDSQVEGMQGCHTSE